VEEGLDELELHFGHTGLEMERAYGFFIGRETKDFFFFLFFDGFWLGLSLALEALCAGRHSLRNSWWRTWLGN
jgi:hypothetical protein